MHPQHPDSSATGSSGLPAGGSWPPPVTPVTPSPADRANWAPPAFPSPATPASGSQPFPGTPQEDRTSAAPPKRRTRALASLVAALWAFGLVLSGQVGEWWTDLTGSETVGPGVYAFIRMQPGTTSPVGYDPCRTIEVAVNPLHAPDGYGDMVDTVIEQVRDASGLDVRRVADTYDRQLWTVRPVVRRPVLIVWDLPANRPSLEGTVAGYAGSLWERDASGHREYLTGQITLDSELFATSSKEEGQAIIAHEFGHVLGLDHVADPSELMFKSVTERRTFGKGDLAGLKRLGEIPCATPEVSPSAAPAD